jgi:hypothetical protein
MDLSILIVNYKNKAKTISCIESIKQADLTGLTYEIIMVDNNSADGTIEELKLKYPEVKCLASQHNRGMGGGNNLAARGAIGEYLMILNNDTLVKTDSIKKLINYYKSRQDIGLLGPKLQYPDGRLQNTCLRFPGILTPFYRRTFLGKFAKRHLDRFIYADYDHQTVKEVDWVQGSAMLIKHSLFEELAGFDELFFMYFEDIDLCRRIWQSGLKVIYYPESVIIHDHTRASANDRWYLAPFTNRLSQIHLASWIKYFIKWKFKANL